MAGADEQLDQLERLGRLKESGVIDQQEFATQKRHILVGAQTPGGDGVTAGGPDAPFNADR